MTVVRSGYERRHNDLYETQVWVTDVLLKHFPLRGRRVWEPAAGNHKMVDALRAHGAGVVTSDIKTYDRDHDFLFDFLSDEPRPLLVRRIDALVTNPPYGKQNRDAVRFAERALARCDGLVALLLTAKFDSGKTRAHLLRDNPRFAAKIVLLDRIQWFAGETGGTEDHAWFVWGPAIMPVTPRLIWEGIGGR